MLSVDEFIGELPKQEGKKFTHVKTTLSGSTRIDDDASSICSTLSSPSLSHAEEYEGEDEMECGNKSKQVTFADGCSERRGFINRVGTGFMHLRQLRKLISVTIDDTHGDNENKLMRKGTGFVRVDEMPQNDREELARSRCTGLSQLGDLQKLARVKIVDNHGDNQNKLIRKGTGFVRPDSLAFNLDADEENLGHVRFADISANIESNRKAHIRKGTPFVHPDESLLDADEENLEHVRFADISANIDSTRKAHIRKGTPFVHLDESLLDADEENLEHVRFADISANIESNGKALIRKGTPFVHQDESLPSDGEDA